MKGQAEAGIHGSPEEIHVVRSQGKNLTLSQGVLNFWTWHSFCFVLEMQIVSGCEHGQP